MNRRALVAAAMGLAITAPALATAQHGSPVGAPPAAMDHQKMMAMIQELAPGVDLEALGDQIRAVVRDNAPAGADVEKLQNQVFEMFHQAMAQAGDGPEAKAHLKEMLAMVTAAKTDPAAREHVRVMLAMHAAG